MSSRDAILSRMRRSLGVTGNDVERRAAVSDRLQRPPKGLIPKRGQLDPRAQVDLFIAMAQRASATVARLDSAADIPAAVSDYLRSKNMPQAIRRGHDPRLAELAWDSQPNLDISIGRSHGNDLAGLSHAFGGVVESGTLVMVSGDDNPTTLNFLPEYHLVVIKAGDIAGDYETIWSRIRAAYGKGIMPRTVNMITGPSRSGDIEQTLLLGAHGPRSLHILVVDE
jgi:L-lactate dehydrogenase complex protein LldG